MPDTRVSVLRADRGIIAGYAVVWNVKATSFYGETFRYTKSRASDWFLWPDAYVVSGHFGEQRRDFIGPALRTYPDKHGLKAEAICHDADTMRQIELGLLYFSPYIIDWSGLITITHLALTDSPGFPRTRAHKADNEAVNANIDTTLAALEWAQTDIQRNATNYEGLDEDAALVKALDRYLSAGIADGDTCGLFDASEAQARAQRGEFGGFCT